MDLVSQMLNNSRRLFVLLVGLFGIAVVGMAALIVASKFYRVEERGRMQISKTEFQRKELRVHALLADVPLSDVWVFRLSAGNGEHKLRDFRELWSEDRIKDLGPVVEQLFKLRNALGDLFSWDNEENRITVSSYAKGLTKNELEHSRVQPGTPVMGSFHALYEFENEALDEIINATVHVFSLMAMEKTAEGYTVYWAIYVKNTSRITPIYMALIEPFRKLLVYPAIIKKLELVWESKYGSVEE